MKQTILKCGICGAVAEVIVECPGYTGLVCCGQPMQEEIPQTADQTKEKHVPVGEVFSKWETKVKVGSTLHPMTEEHLIEWVAVETEKGYQVQYLSAGEAPVCNFKIADGDKAVAVYAYCNLHGLWKTE